jgi:hypothetical protein
VTEEPLYLLTDREQRGKEERKEGRKEGRKVKITETDCSLYTSVLSVHVNVSS